MENDILTTHGSDDNELVKYMPRLKPEDVAQAVIFAITTPQHVLVSRFDVFFFSPVSNVRLSNNSTQDALANSEKRIVYPMGNDDLILFKEFQLIITNRY